MSELRVDNIVDMGGSGAPQLRKGANVTGISTITQAVVGNATINAGGINATGILTSTSNKFVGDFASGNITAGVMTATSSVVASNITINSGGVNASGIVSATSYAGSGANLTGIGLSIAPLAYNPDVSDTLVEGGTGIGLTFNQRVSAGVGTVTLSLVSVGSTVYEVFGLGNVTSTTYTVTVASSKFHLDGNQTYSPTLYPGNIYTFDQSAGTNATHPLRFATAADAAGSTEYTTGVETNGTPGSSGAYTRITVAADAPDTLYYYCSNHSGMGSNVSIGANVQYNNDSNPPNITISPKTGLSADTVYAINYPPGAFTQSGAGGSFVGTAYTFATKPLLSSLFAVGSNSYGQLGQNTAGNPARRSSPVQIPGIWTDLMLSGSKTTKAVAGIKTGNELYTWGLSVNGSLGHNQGNEFSISSPTQIPGSWLRVAQGSERQMGGIKTGNTLWMWGNNERGTLGQNNTTAYSSPIQIPGTTWEQFDTNGMSAACIRTDNTLWVWGNNSQGRLGLNQSPGTLENVSSPKQVPGTTWKEINLGTEGAVAIKTDGTLWTWGNNDTGHLGHNNETDYSSPRQVPGTTWKDVMSGENETGGVKTDGTLWTWGANDDGQLGLNNRTNYSSPVQIPGTSWSFVNAVGGGHMGATKTDGTCWTWGLNQYGQLGLNDRTYRSSPTQVPGTTYTSVIPQHLSTLFLKNA